LQPKHADRSQNQELAFDSHDHVNGSSERRLTTFQAEPIELSISNIDTLEAE
jgi:hypothetical protein